ncbi:hypothetical protein D2Q93_14285 [Alicyclobacillaceae bacterium I2511]|nr:hypothetical protein D2Q93_14285 [Alicyclobacillaceae bacterium I2511]
MSGKAYRMSRLFHPQDGRTVILPVDHGVALGDVEGLHNPGLVLRNLVDIGPDAILLNTGLSQAVSEIFYQPKAPARILTVDNFFLDSTNLVHFRIGWAEQAVVEGYDAIKVLFPWDGSIQERMESTKLVAEFIKESNQWQIPIIVEPTLLREMNLKVLADAVRVAFELGADILKTPYPGDKDVLKEWVDIYKVPIVLLGGPKGTSDTELLSAVADAMQVGAKGVAIGRNVWQREPSQAINFFRSLVQTVHSETR